MKNLTSALAIALVCALLPTASEAATLDLTPASSIVAPGSVFSLDLVISGLGDAAAPSVGDFDIDIGFDSGALGLVGFGVGPALGDLGTGEAIDVSFGEIMPGLVNIAEVSFLADAELDSLQPDTFVLATLDFMVLGAGISTFVDISSVLSLGDALGSPIAIDSVSGAEITVVPLPATFWLLVSACGLLSMRRRRR